MHGKVRSATRLLAYGARIEVLLGMRRDALAEISSSTELEPAA
jgi:hypothetical protein